MTTNNENATESTTTTPEAKCTPITTLKEFHDALSSLSSIKITKNRWAFEKAEELRKIEEKYGEFINPLETQEAMLLPHIEEFARNNRATLFPKAKTTVIGMLKLSFRAGTGSVSILPDFSEQQVIDNLKEAGYESCVQVKVSLNKTELKKAVPEDKRAKLGFEVVTTENFSCDLNN